MQVVNVDGFLDGVNAEFIGGAIDATTANATAGQEHAETGMMMVATGLGHVLFLVELGVWRATEFAAPYHQSVFKQSSFLQIAEERGSGAVAVSTKGLVLAVVGGMSVPGLLVFLIHVVDLHRAHSGLDESPGEKVLFEGRVYKTYRGMGSLGAMQQGSKDRYFQGDVADAEKLVPEGIEGRVPYKGKARDVLYQMVGGLRSGMGYCGCATIGDFQARAQLVRATGAGMIESHPHDIQITKEAPNYGKR